jgi:hypothetical protein
MSNHIEWSTPEHAGFQLADQETANEQWDLPDQVDGAYALALTNGGHGLLVEGDLKDIVEWVDKLHSYVHHQHDVLTWDEDE